MGVRLYTTDETSVRATGRGEWHYKWGSYNLQEQEWGGKQEVVADTQYPKFGKTDMRIHRGVEEW